MTRKAPLNPLSVSLRVNPPTFIATLFAQTEDNCLFAFSNLPSSVGKGSFNSLLLLDGLVYCLDPTHPHSLFGAYHQLSPTALDFTFMFDGPFYVLVPSEAQWTPLITNWTLPLIKRGEFNELFPEYLRPSRH